MDEYWSPQELTCPECLTYGTLVLDYRLVAKDLGSYSLAGTQPKIAAREVPHLVCTNEDCSFIQQARE